MQIINNKPRIYTVGKVRLMPGTNEVPDADAKEFVAHKAVKARIESGALTVVKPTRKTKAAASDEMPQA